MANFLEAVFAVTLACFVCAWALESVAANMRALALLEGRAAKLGHVREAYERQLLGCPAASSCPAVPQ